MDARRQLTVGELFAGIGGFGLGLERAGMRVIWHAEIDPYACAVLRKHWPSVPNHGDVRSIRAGTVERPDVICGGFPCQDISVAGSGRGLEGERSGLWREFRRIVGDLRPRFVVVENVGALTSRGLAEILGDFAALGYDAEWHVVPAAAVDAPHLRERCWIIASDTDGCEQGRRIEPQWRSNQRDADATRHGAEGNVATDTDGGTIRHDEQREAGRRHDVQHGGHAELAHGGEARPATDTDSGRREVERVTQHDAEQSAPGCIAHGLGSTGRWGGALVTDAESIGRRSMESAEQQRPEPSARSAIAANSTRERIQGNGPAGLEITYAPRLARLLGRDDAGSYWQDWPTQSPLCGSDDGLPNWAHRMRVLGLAVVPQIAEMIGRAIMDAEAVA